MTDAASPRTAPSPFHPGELAVQARVGVRERVEDFGRRGIRDHMPEQHRTFFGQLPLFFIGSVDAKARPWASVLAGGPGFVQAPGPKTLAIRALPGPADPLAEGLHRGAHVGGLGLELHTRRRNRINGRVTKLGRDQFSISVDQSFGNCPQYIQARRPTPRALAGSSSVRRSAWTDEDRDLIARSDTLFIASAFRDAVKRRSRGVDISHRGGLPGFVRQLDDGTLLIPDYRGNFFFNTLGNIQQSPRCGLLFIDFESGDTLQATGVGEIIWNEREHTFPEGAQRLLAFRPEALVHTTCALPYSFEFLSMSPQLAPA